MREFLQKHLIRFIVKDVFHTLSSDDILKIRIDEKGNKIWEWKGKEMSLEMIAAVTSQAKTFEGSTLWKVLKAELQWNALKTLIEKGTSETDIRAAQLLGYITKVIDEKLKEIIKIK